MKQSALYQQAMENLDFLEQLAKKLDNRPRSYPRYIIAGWFDLLGIENGVQYIRYNRASCTLS